ncbi:hypothetical protein AXG93_793s1030 [Marchantia polymorpha subsp. ruderalis]|uniref:Uncharacterized protein n=1 Tax=Marchantia polymorpha subsp. ruderalis TaxID=1480154 RepID=A0A176W211_MARPO|nr:hypothetical protein AXG93_793s1030 [Marchantia polymorpha subsp. ruderalis]
MLLWRKYSPSAEEEKKKKTAKASAFAASAFAGHTATDEVPASTPPARLRAEEEPRGARAPRKRKWDGEADLSQLELPTVPAKLQANNEPTRPKQKARNLILPADSSADTRRAAVARNSPSSEEDVSAEILGRSTDLHAPKALVPLEEAHRPSGHRIVAGEGSDGKTCVPLAQAPSAVAVREGVAGPPGAATKILETEDDTPSKEEEVQSVRGTPSGVLYEQVVPLLWYFDRKATKYGDSRQCGSYVELVKNQTRIKVATNPELMALDQKYRQLEKRYNFLQDQCSLSRKLQKTAIQLRDELVSKAQPEIEELRARVQTEISSGQAQNRILAGELVQQTRALEQSEAARRADEELLGRLQSQCNKLRTQRAAAELQWQRLKATINAQQIAR